MEKTKKMKDDKINPIQDGPFWTYSLMGEAKSQLHISYNDETLQTYTLTKETPKNK